MVKKWVDYSSKYGLGYLLSNEATGVYFNDSTKIIQDPNRHHFNYITRRGLDLQDVEPKEYTIVDHPKDLMKKVALIKYFTVNLGVEKKAEAPILEIVQDPVRKVDDIVYVKKWMVSKHAIMFRLSNKVVQVNFQDHTEIMLSSKTKMVTYVNKKGERSSYPLSSAMESENYDMVKRLKFTKDALTNM